MTHIPLFKIKIQANVIMIIVIMGPILGFDILIDVLDWELLLPFDDDQDQ